MPNMLREFHQKQQQGKMKIKQLNTCFMSLCMHKKFVKTYKNLQPHLLVGSKSEPVTYHLATPAENESTIQNTLYKYEWYKAPNCDEKPLMWKLRILFIRSKMVFQY